MKWASAASDAQRFAVALDEVTAAVSAQLGGARPDLALVFVSPHHAAALDGLGRAVAERLGPTVLVGCTAGGVIGDGREIEQRPGLSLAAAVMPGVEVTPFHGDGGTVELPIGGRPTFLLLAEPFTVDTQALARALDDAYPGCTIVGGVASGGGRPGETALLLDGAVHRSGAVGVALDGPLEVDAIVAQGCRPVGVPMFITRAEENRLFELNGRPIAAVLRELFDALPGRDQALFRQSLFLGIAMSEKREQYRLGDFLVRNVLGRDPATGALAIGAALERHGVVQFHLRDAATSTEELDGLLTRYVAEARAGEPAGALLFSCLGRGVGLFGEPDHDSRLFRRRLGDVPLGGFFCNGEIGPIHGSTFLHGYTSVFAIFRAVARAGEPR